MLDSNNRRPTVTLQKGETDLARKHRLVVKLIGYDASEQHRPTITDDDFYLFKYPLREWGWDRSACADVLKRHAFRIPVKSACFY